MAVPEFLVRKLYVPGSLAELEEGFAFVLRNTFAPATVQSLAIEVDGTLAPPAAVSLTSMRGLPMTTQMLSEACRFSSRWARTCEWRCAGWPPDRARCVFAP